MATPYTKHRYLVSGFTEGFKLRLDSPVADIAREISSHLPHSKSNNKSARVNLNAIEEKLPKEIMARWMIGPFPMPVFPHFIVSPLGLREKKTPGKFRVIHDLSAHFGGLSVNSHILMEAGTVSYDTVDKAISLIQDIGPGVVLAKTDIEHAYKLIPIHPQDILSLGLRWYDDWLWDCTLPMCSRSGCAISELFLEAIQFLAEAQGCGKMSHVLDDFLMVSVNKDTSDARLSTFLSMCHLLGIPVVLEKTESGTCLTFLGITLDTIKMEARLPLDKLLKCLRLVRSYKQLQKISIKQQESLTGLLNFSCRVIRPGQPFLRRLYNLMEGIRRRLPFFKLRLNAGANEDLRIWELFLQSYNGVNMFLPPHRPHPLQYGDTTDVGRQQLDTAQVSLVG